VSVSTSENQNGPSQLDGHVGMGNIPPDGFISIWSRYPGKYYFTPSQHRRPCSLDNANGKQELCGSRSPDAADTGLANELPMDPGVRGSFPRCRRLATRVMHAAKSSTVEPCACVKKRTV